MRLRAGRKLRCAQVLVNAANIRGIEIDVFPGCSDGNSCSGTSRARPEKKDVHEREHAAGEPMLRASRRGRWP